MNQGLNFEEYYKDVCDLILESVPYHPERSDVTIDYNNNVSVGLAAEGYVEFYLTDNIEDIEEDIDDDDDCNCCPYNFDDPYEC